MDELNEMIQVLPWVLSVALLILSVVLAINWLCTKFELDEMNELNSRLFLDRLYKKKEADTRYDARTKELHDFKRLADIYMCNDANELKLLIEDMARQVSEQEKLAAKNLDYHKRMEKEWLRCSNTYIRSMWLARAIAAKRERDYWYHVHSITRSSDGELFKANHRGQGYLGLYKRPIGWVKTWDKVMELCHKKSEEYK